MLQIEKHRNWNKLGSIQKLWIKQLCKYPERQIVHDLGIRISKRKYKACALGELLLCKYRIQKKKFPFIGLTLMDEDNPYSLFSYDSLGLYNSTRRFKSKDKKTGKYYSIAGLNDTRHSWRNIAEIVLRDPKNVFYKKV